MGVFVYGVVAAHSVLVCLVVTCTVMSILGALNIRSALAKIYLVCAAAVMTSQLIYGECLLTVWEKTLRNRWMPSTAYHNSFLGHYCPWIPHGFYNTVGPGLLVLGVICVPLRAWRYRKPTPANIGEPSQKGARVVE